MATTHEVFISYSSKDKTIADAVCARLEAAGVRCWIAPRNILPGADWGEAIIGAIEQCKAFVLVFSEHANVSPTVGGELEKAFGLEIPVLSFRIREVKPSRNPPVEEQ